MTSRTWMSKVAEVLRRAAHIHSARGGTKGTMQDGNGRVCMWGAIARALGWDGSRNTALFGTDIARKITALMGEVFQDCSPYPGANWNDMPSVHDEDVQKLLLQLADQVEVGKVTLRV